MKILILQKWNKHRIIPAQNILGVRTLLFHQLLRFNWKCLWLPKRCFAFIFSFYTTINQLSNLPLSIFIGIDTTSKKKRRCRVASIKRGNGYHLPSYFSHCNPLQWLSCLCNDLCFITRIMGISFVMIVYVLYYLEIYQ